MKMPLILTAFILMSLFTSAQIERKPMKVKSDSTSAASPGVETGKPNREEIFKELDLTREQRIKLKEIRQSNKEAKDAVENNTGLSDQDKKKQLRELQKAQAEKVQAILTDEQKAKFRAAMQGDQ